MKKNKKFFRRLFFIPIVAGGLFAILELLGALDPIENRLYDLFLHWKPAVKEAPSVVLLDIDETSIEKVSSWPWPRGLVARGLETLAEVGAGQAVFDIEYNEKSPMSADRQYYKGPLKMDFYSFFNDAGGFVQQVFQSLANGSIGAKDAADYGAQLLDFLAQGRDDLYQKAGLIAVENDSYLGKAMRLFGRTSVTVNLQARKIDPPLESRALAAQRFAVPGVVFQAPLKTENVDFISPITEVTSMASDAGFTNVKIDSDGIRRRIRLVDEIDGKAYLQLVFAPLRHILGDPTIVYRAHSILLKDALYGGKRVDVSIPLDEKGYMLIRWTKKNYNASFKHVSFYQLLQYRDNEDLLMEVLGNLANSVAWSFLPDIANPLPDIQMQWGAVDHARLAALDSGSPESRAAWLAQKVAYKKTISDFFAAGYDQKVHNALLARESLDKAANAASYDELDKNFALYYSSARNTESIIAQEEADLRQTLSGALCIIGWTATATTDMGANPFNESFVNVGTHAAIANGILQRDFLSDLPRWVAALEALLFAFAVVFVASRFETLGQIVIGLTFTIVTFWGDYLVFHVWGIWSSVLAPTLATFLSFLSYALVSFLMESREKNFLRKAFSTYLSGDVINEIVDDPSLLKLGGQKKWITATFTDVKGFSTISEKLDPEQLVHLLNVYLSAMSDIILDERGTIDKYEGDAIISFFGAPVTFDAHARAACRSAVLMKRREAELNQRFVAQGESPTPLLTRIGINTGDMVVGNMGTERKMNYTIMGNAVNLAARLEGVNKQYGSWILESDECKQAAGDEFVTRRFDQVRVVGIRTPVQLWELVDFRSDISRGRLDFLDRFEEAHRSFDARDWRRAAAQFAALAGEDPADAPSATYLRRSEEFLATPPAPDWDGVFNLTEK